MNFLMLTTTAFILSLIVAYLLTDTPAHSTKEASKLKASVHTLSDQKKDNRSKTEKQTITKNTPPNTTTKDAQDKNKNAIDISQEQEERYRILSDNEIYPTLSSRLNQIIKRRPTINISPEDVLSSLEKKHAWTTKDQPGTLVQKLNNDELNDGRAFINFDPIKVETLMPGDYMDIAIESIGQTLEMKVNSVNTFKDGNIQWQGNIINSDDDGTVYITQSEHVTVASVILSQTDYTLESHGEDGWIVDSAVLFKVNPTDIDTVIPLDEEEP